jgi:hypothetical protein
LPGRRVGSPNPSDVTGFTPVTGCDEAYADTRAALEAEWLDLTRRVLPALAAERGWPVRADHCFQRILLDHAVGGRWYDHIAGRPAYRCAETDVLARAISLARLVLAGEADLHALNRQSLAWRGKHR